MKNVILQSWPRSVICGIYYYRVEGTPPPTLYPQGLLTPPTESSRRISFIVEGQIASLVDLTATNNQRWKDKTLTGYYGTTTKFWEMPARTKYMLQLNLLACVLQKERRFVESVLSVLQCCP